MGLRCDGDDRDDDRDDERFDDDDDDVELDRCVELCSFSCLRSLSDPDDVRCRCSPLRLCDDDDLLADDRSLGAGGTLISTSSGSADAVVSAG